MAVFLKGRENGMENGGGKSTAQLMANNKQQKCCNKNELIRNENWS